MALASTITMVTALTLAQAVPTPSDMGRSVAPLVDAVKDTVVTIRSLKVIVRAEREDPFTRFFRERMGMGRSAPRGTERQERGLGSGFLVNLDGRTVIFTNNHVVAGADEVQVVTSDNRVLPAKVVGSDPGTDVAVVALTRPPSNLKLARLGDSDRLRVGDYVLAIGNPLGLGQTVTMGIVSAKERSLEGKIVDYADFIQTDAAINQGNSGGPLFNFNGEVVGVNSAILNPAMAMNVGFAIPINLARRVGSQLLKSGRVLRGYLGVFTTDLTPELAQRLGLPPDSGGALVNQVGPGSPAAGVGLRPNDLIVEMAGRRIDSSNALSVFVKTLAPGQSVPLVVLRGGKRLNLQVTLSDNPELRAQSELGMELHTVPGEQAAALGIPPGSGLVVLSVDARAPVSGTLREGDVIAVLNLGRQQLPATIKNLREFQKNLERGRRGQLVIIRDGEPFAVNL